SMIFYAQLEIIFLVLISPTGSLTAVSFRSSAFAALTSPLFIPRSLALQSAEAAGASTLLSQKRQCGSGATETRLTQCETGKTPGQALKIKPKTLAILVATMIE